jgi:hypothetical protein
MESPRDKDAGDNDSSGRPLAAYLYPGPCSLSSSADVTCSDV